MTKLEEFLELKPLYYKEIDYDRMPRVWKKIKKDFKVPKIIHIVGTNGKGSTGRFLAWHLYKSGESVGHYSSPHILKFNERIWIDGKDVSDESLQEAHEYLQKLLSKEDIDALSYFEYTTLLAMLIFKECEYVVLEAGLGGEYDATSVFDNILTLATTIGLDHESFLGESIIEIARTKLNAIQKALILGYQESGEVREIAKEICKKKGAKFLEYKEFDKAKELVKDLALPDVFIHNLSLASSAFEYLGFEIDFRLFYDIKLFGRAQKLAKNITIDVGHNALAAKALKKHFDGKKIELVFNTFADKDYKKSLEILKPIINKVHIIEVKNQRIEDIKELRETLKSLDIEFDDFKEISRAKEYLVFGSFSVVEEFLKKANLKF